MKCIYPDNQFHVLLQEKLIKDVLSSSIMSYCQIFHRHINLQCTSSKLDCYCGI